MIDDYENEWFKTSDLIAKLTEAPGDSFVALTVFNGEALLVLKHTEICRELVVMDESNGLNAKP